MYKISIVVPVYNEKETIKDFIINLKEAIQKINLLSECIVVDDYSDDGTIDVLRTLDVMILTHNANLGYGAALKTGIDRAEGDIICIIDSDNEFAPRDIQQLIPFIDEYDMVIGARIKDVARDFPWYQKIAKGFVCLLLSLIYKQKILDINSGFRLIKKDIVKKYYSILPDGFSFTASITLAMLSDNYRIKYVPVSYFKRGKSKIKVFSYTVNFIKSYLRIIYSRKFANNLTK